jgi:hypothetical protein
MRWAWISFSRAAELGRREGGGVGRKRRWTDSGFIQGVAPLRADHRYQSSGMTVRLPMITSAQVMAM